VKVSSRVRPLIWFALIIATVQVVQHVFDWHRYRHEREELVALRERLVDAGAELVREQLEADRIRSWLDAEEQRLAGKRNAVESYGRHARDNVLPHHLYGAYRQDVEELNERIRMRNQKLEELRLTIARRNSAADRYNVLADSMRTLAVTAGDPYHAIPLPAEAAAQRGIEFESFR
jgi:hypothetical protein